MSQKLIDEAVEKLSVVDKYGKAGAIDAINRHGGDIIKKEEDEKGNIKFFYSEHNFFYYDVVYADIAMNPDD